MASNFGDVTVVGDGPVKHSDDFTLNTDSLSKRLPHSTIVPSRQPRGEFTTSDYAPQERPFFVPIGNGGVLAALQKLDRQVVNVGCNQSSHLSLWLTRKLVWAIQYFLQEETHRLDWKGSHSWSNRSHKPWVRTTALALTLYLFTFPVANLRF